MYVFNMSHPLPIYVYFLSFQLKNTILQQIHVKNVHPESSAGFKLRTSWLGVSSLNL